MEFVTLFRIELSCKECGKKFRTKKGLEEHRYAHGEANFKCPECPFTTKSPIHLRKHTRTGQCPAPANPDEPTQEEDMSLPVLKPRRHRCPQCPYSSKYPEKLEQHVTDVHATAPDNQRTGHDSNRSRFQCFICKIRLHYLSHLRSHLLYKHPIEKCQICDEELLLGVESHDCLGERSLPCEYCARPFVSLPRLLVHFGSEHADAEKLIYVCDICRRQVHTRILMEAHREKHTRGSFVCNKCPEVFDKKMELSLHKRRNHRDASKGNPRNPWKNATFLSCCRSE